MKLRLATLTIGFAILLGCGGSGDEPDPDPATELAVQTLATGLDQPMQYLAHPENRSQAYVLERSGRVRLLVNDALQTDPVLDLAGQVSTAGEGGLLGAAFDPRNARVLYVHFTEGAEVDTVVQRFHLSADGRTATPGNRILRIGQAPFENHKGGSVHVGNDGYLYLATGDGGSANDPQNRSQDPESLLGKILRLDPDRDDFPADPDQNYAIPSGNPYIGNAGVRPEIWAFGLRNPFRWSIDRPTGDLYIADVGQDLHEEVNIEPAGRPGRNYGWRVREGNAVTGNAGPAFGSTFQAPFLVLGRGQARSITGGFRYRGDALGLGGRYLFADFVMNRFWSVPVRFSGGEAVPAAAVDVVEHAVAGGVSNVVSIEPDANGEPVVTELGGRVLRLIRPAGS